MSESEDQKRERLSRPFGRCMRDLCKEKGLTAGQIAAQAAHNTTHTDSASTAKLSKSTVVDMLDGTTWAPRNEETLSRLVQAMRLDKEQEARLREAARLGADARAAKVQQVETTNRRVALAQLKVALTTAVGYRVKQRSRELPRPRPQLPSLQAARSRTNTNCRHHVGTFRWPCGLLSEQ